MTGYIYLGLAVLIIVINFIIILILCNYSTDGYDALFVNSLTKIMLKICGVIQIVFLKVLFLPLLMVLASNLICIQDRTLMPPNV